MNFAPELLDDAQQLVSLLFLSPPNPLVNEPNLFCQLITYCHPPFKHTPLPGRDTFALQLVTLIVFYVVIFTVKSHIQFLRCR